MCATSTRAKGMPSLLREAEEGGKAESRVMAQPAAKAISTPLWRNWSATPEGEEGEEGEEGKEEEEELFNH